MTKKNLRMSTSMFVINTLQRIVTKSVTDIKCWMLDKRMDTKTMPFRLIYKHTIKNPWFVVIQEIPLCHRQEVM